MSQIPSGLSLGGMPPGIGGLMPNAAEVDGRVDLSDAIDADFLRPLVSGWTGKIEAAKKARAKWEDVAKDCLAFFSESSGFMWEDNYKFKFWDQSQATPRFRLTMQKAFELVAIFGPTLFHDIPHRRVEPTRLPNLPPSLFGMPQNPQDPNDPVVQAQQNAQQQQAMESTRDKLVAELMETWLNYTPREMPGGGLEQHGQLAVQDALITGRGVLYTRPYKMPGSGRTLTGCFRLDPFNLLVDPDSYTLEEAKWIAIKHVDPHWEVERRFNLDPDSLKGKSSLESLWSQGELVGNEGADNERRSGQTNDLVIWYEIYSKTGCGARLTGMNIELKDEFEKEVGDYAYLAICPACEYPLNLPTDALINGAPPEWVKSQMQWPVPLWADDKWPVEVLDFYPHPKRSWPIAPLAPGLGELKFLNVMVSHLCNRIQSSSRDFIAVAERAYETLRKHLESGSDMTIIPVPEIVGDIKEAITWLQQPQTNLDVWKIIEAVSEIFDKRVGLSELLYGGNPGGTQPRSAEEVSTKQQSVSVRPQYMAAKVEQWMGRAAANEGFIARWFVRSQDVVPLMGTTAAQAWDQVVATDNIEEVVRQMSYTVASGSMRPPNKSRDVANIGQAMQIMGPAFQQYAQVTTDTNPLNSLWALWAKAADFDATGLQLGQWMPPPPPPQPPQPDPNQARLQFEQARHEQDLAYDAKEQEQKLKFRAQEQAQRQQAQAQQQAQQVPPGLGKLLAMMKARGGMNNGSH